MAELRAQDFDVEMARRYGKSDKEIADFLSGLEDYDSQGARQAGYSDEQIISFLTTGKKIDPTTPVKAFERGMSTGLSQIAGAPVDLATAALNKLRQVPPTSPFYEPAEPIDDAFGSSASIRRGMEQIGMDPYESLSELPSDVRPIAAAGEVFGGGLPIAAAPLGAARLGARGRGVLEPIMTAARQRPGQFALAEVSGLTGAAQGAAGAELLAPDNPLARFGGEVAGGFLNPVSLVLRGVRGAVNEVKTMVSSLTPQGRQSRAAEIIQKALQEAGEDPDLLIRKLNEQGLVSLTSGQKTGSPTLLAMEARLGKQSAKFSNTAQAKAEGGFRQLRELMSALEASGDPQMLVTAAKVRQQYFDSVLGARFKTAEAEAVETSARLAGDTRASQRATNIVEQSLSEARKVEAELWGKVNQKATTSPDNIVASYDELKTTLLKEEKVDPVVEALVTRLRKEKSVSVQELSRVRTRTLTLAREARARGEWDKARQYGDIASGALEDLSRITGREAEDARNFSRSLNDTFTRTFAGDVLETDAGGARRIHPDLVLERAFGSGGAGANVRLGQLQSAAEFSGFGGQMLSEQEKFLRLAAKQTTDPQTGRVNPRQLERFIQDNESVLERFPGLRRDLADASSAEQAFKTTEQSIKTASRQIQKRAAFSQLLEYEDPSEAIGAALSSKTPEQSYSRLTVTAKRAGPGAVGGLKAATLDHLAKQATDAKGNFSFTKYRQLLTQPINQNGPNTLELMRRQGVLNRGDEIRLQRILQEAEKIETALATGARADELIDAPDALVDFVIRVGGANLGGAGALGQVSGAPLIAASAGSRFMRTLFEKVPRTRLQDVLIEAAEKPELMASLLARPKTAVEARQLERQINAFLIQAGIAHSQNEER